MNAPLALNEADRAAVILMLMEDEEAAALLEKLDPHELQLVGEKMVQLGEIGPDRIADAIEGFVEHAQTQTLPAHDRPAEVHRRMARAWGISRRTASCSASCPRPAPVRWNSRGGFRRGCWPIW